MNAWDDAKFKRRYRNFYLALCLIACCFFIFCVIGFSIHASNYKKEVFSWQFKGVVSNLHSPGHDVVYITVNHVEYGLYEYKTWGNLSKDHHTGNDSTTFDFNSAINNGDSIIKIKNEWNIKLKKQNGDVLIFKSHYNQ